MKRILHFKFSRPARLLLRIAMPLILLASITLLLSYLDARTRDPILANLTYPPLMEYIAASVLITVGGSIIIHKMEKTDSK